MEPRGTTQGPLGKLPRGCTGGDPQPRRCGAYSLVRIGNHPHPPSIQTLQHSASEEAAQGPGGRGGSGGAWRSGRQLRGWGRPFGGLFCCAGFPSRRRGGHRWPRGGPDVGNGAQEVGGDWVLRPAQRGRAPTGCHSESRVDEGVTSALLPSSAAWPTWHHGAASRTTSRSTRPTCCSSTSECPSLPSHRSPRGPQCPRGISGLLGVPAPPPVSLTASHSPAA